MYRGVNISSSLFRREGCLTVSDHLGLSSGNLATGDPSCKRPLWVVSQESGTLGFALLEANWLHSTGHTKTKTSKPQTIQPNQTTAAKVGLAWPQRGVFESSWRGHGCPALMSDYWIMPAWCGTVEDVWTPDRYAACGFRTQTHSPPDWWHHLACYFQVTAGCCFLPPNEVRALPFYSQGNRKSDLHQAQGCQCLFESFKNHLT